VGGVAMSKGAGGRLLRLSAAVGFSVLLTVALLEVAVHGLVEAGLLQTPRPARPDTRFWQGDHPRFGVWHRPGTSLRHKTDCFDVVYETNSIGARDRERSAKPLGRRILVLGDSFLEGWGLPLAERLSDRLEAQTGVEHLNLAMSHFGPYQSFLAYEEFAPRFAHDGVLVGIVPVNDFRDLDYEHARTAPGYEYRYRPYLVGRYPDYRSVFLHEPWWQTAPRRLSYAWNAVDRVLHPPEASPRPVSAFYRFTEEDFDRLRFCLERLVARAEGRPVAVVLIPAEVDLLRYAPPDPSPLAQRLRGALGGSSVQVVDLLPPLAERAATPESYYFPCDYHWNAAANEVAAAILRDVLRGSLYRGAAGSPGAPTTAPSRTIE
jgi:acetyltransferase AlgX (SGNH hydrolase-like protein)